MSEDHSPHQLQAPVDGNLHVTLRERAPAAGSGAAVTAAVDRRSTPTLGTAPTELVLFAASSPRELLAKAELLDPGRPVAELARASQLRLKAGPAPAGPVRLAVTAADTAELIAKLDAAAGRITGNPRCGFSTPTGIHYATGTSRAGMLAFVFPGQGSQYIGMGGDLVTCLPSAQALWDRHAAPPANGGEALHRIVFPPPALTEIERAAQESRLAVAEWAQAALAVHSLTLVRALQDLGVKPGCLGGHGFGGLVARHVAGAYDGETLLRLARSGHDARWDAATRVDVTALDVYADTYGAPRSAKPVLFDDQIEAMYASGVRTFVEVGAGCELTGMVGRVLGTKQHNALSLDRRGRHGLTSLQDAIGTLYTLGLDPDFGCWWAHRELPPPAVRAKSTVTVMIDRPVDRDRRMASEAVAPKSAAPKSAAPKSVAPESAAAPVGLQLPAGRDWLRAIEETRRQLADAHTAYQRMLTESHLAFVKASEAVLDALRTCERSGVKPGVELDARVDEPVAQAG